MGKWDKLPLKTLQDALLNNGICDVDNVKVLDKASVRWFRVLLCDLFFFTLFAPSIVTSYVCEGTDCEI